MDLKYIVNDVGIENFMVDITLVTHLFSGLHEGEFLTGVKGIKPVMLWSY